VSNVKAGVGLLFATVTLSKARGGGGGGTRFGAGGRDVDVVQDGLEEAAVRKGDEGEDRGLGGGGECGGGGGRERGGGGGLC